MHGYGEFYWPVGKKYFGYYRNDKKNGLGAFFWKDNAKIYIGLWLCGKQSGPGIMYYNNKTVKYGIWEDGILIKWYKSEWEFEKDNNEYPYINFLSRDPIIILNIFL